MMLNIRISVYVCAKIVSLLSFPSNLALDDSAYMVLSAKIQGVNMEVNYLRNELDGTKSRVETIENQKNRNITHLPTCTCTAGDADDDLYTDFDSKAQQYMKIMKRAWMKEKIQSRQHRERVHHKLLETKTTLEEKIAITNADISATDADISVLRDTVGENGEELKCLARSLDDIEIRCGKLETEQSKTFETRQDRQETFKSETQKLIVALTARLDETVKELADVRASLGNRVDSLTTQMNDQEKCQSGTVGAAAWPTRAFPYTKTVSFNPPFKQTPSFVYGPVYMDSGYVRFNGRVKRLTKDVFTLEIVTWAEYNLWGLTFRWMACP